PYTPLAGERLQPLGHLTVNVDYVTLNTLKSKSFLTNPAVLPEIAARNNTVIPGRSNRQKTAERTTPYHQNRLL
ncbi:hypothetical protein, partial [Endozoicomonas sp. SESOKO1]|uniref:hypothetical protein n=1 Tax=Endozoicomonas sp. SESOKO1 TaxID=2828742 RepID=UPI0021478405